MVSKILAKNINILNIIWYNGTIFYNLYLLVYAYRFD